MVQYAVYMVECADGTLYTGITTDVARRLSEHNDSTRGAKYTRGRRPVRLLCVVAYPDRVSAAREEVRIKRMSHAQKWSLVHRVCADAPTP